MPKVHVSAITNNIYNNENMIQYNCGEPTCPPCRDMALWCVCDGGVGCDGVCVLMCLVVMIMCDVFTCNDHV